MTEAQYLANIVARYGKPPANMRLDEWLAGIENRAAKRTWERTQPGKAKTSAQETYIRRKAWAQAIAFISPCTRVEASDVWGIPGGATDSRLQSLEAGGFAERVPHSKPIQWRIFQEATE